MKLSRPIASLLMAFGLTACSGGTGVDGDSTDAGAEADLSPAIDAGADGSSSLPDTGSPGDAARDADRPEVPMPHQASIYERGPFNVGHRRFDITYDAQLEPGREIKLSIWYPTLDEEGEPGRYLRNVAWDAVIGDASVAIEGQAPLLVFSHGNSALAEQSYFMTEFWASHGWVVVAPYHTGNTIYDVAQGGVRFDSAAVRPQDVSAAMDALYGLDADDPLAGKISDQVVVSGHSFGGFTSLASTGTGFAVEEMIELCSAPGAPTECEFIEGEGVEELFRAGFLDERIDVSIPQAPGGFLVMQDGISQIEIPTLLITGARDRTLPESSEGDPIWETLTGRHVRVDLTNGGHFTFSNMCQLLPGLAAAEDDGCSDEFVEPELAFEIVNAYGLAFARFHLFGDDEGLELLRGEDDRYGVEVTVETKVGALEER